MARWIARFALTSLLLLAPVATLHAQTTPDESMDVEAHALFEAGRTAFAAGRFADALGHFQRAYDLSHRGALLYNIGQCHDRLRHDAEALTAFQGYLAAEPQAEQRAEVEARIAILEQARATTTTTTTTSETPAPEPEPDATTPEPTPAPIDAPPPPSTDPGAGPWVVLGVGAAVAIAGAVLVGVAFSDIDQVQNAPPNSDFSAVRGAYEQAPILSGIGWAALGVGVAMAVGGIVWDVVGSSSGSGSHAELRLTPTGLSLTGAF